MRSYKKLIFLFLVVSAGGFAVDYGTLPKDPFASFPVREVAQYIVHKSMNITYREIFLNLATIEEGLQGMRDTSSIILSMRAKSGEKDFGENALRNMLETIAEYRRALDKASDQLDNQKTLGIYRAVTPELLRVQPCREIYYSQREERDAAGSADVYKFMDLCELINYKIELDDPTTKDYSEESFLTEITRHGLLNSYPKTVSACFPLYFVGSIVACFFGCCLQCHEESIADDMNTELGCFSDDLPNTVFKAAKEYAKSGEFFNRHKKAKLQFDDRITNAQRMLTVLANAHNLDDQTIASDQASDN